MSPGVGQQSLVTENGVNHCLDWYLYCDFSCLRFFVK